MIICGPQPVSGSFRLRDGPGAAAESPGGDCTGALPATLGSAVRNCRSFRASSLCRGASDDDSDDASTVTASTGLGCQDKLQISFASYAQPPEAKEYPLGNKNRWAHRFLSQCGLIDI